MGIQRAMMIVLGLKEQPRTRPERKVEAAEAEPRPDPAVNDSLRQLLGCAELTRHLYLAGPDGIRGEAHANGGHHDEAHDAAVRVLAVLDAQWPRTGLNRVFVEDQDGIVALTRTTEGPLLIAAFDKGTSLAAVAMSMQRLLTHAAPPSSNGAPDRPED